MKKRKDQPEKCVRPGEKLSRKLKSFGAEGRPKRKENAAELQHSLAADNERSIT